MQKVRSNQMIELVRLVASAFVLFIHCPFPRPVGTYISIIGRFAVPFFLLLTGYFSYNANPVQKSIKKLRDTIMIVIITGTICLLWNSLNSYISTKSFSQWIFQYLSLSVLKEFLLFNRAVFFNSVFYYFFIVIYVYLIYIFACKTKTIRFFYLLSPVLFALLFYMCTAFPWYWGGNFLFLGIPLFFLGHYLHAHQTIIQSLKHKELPLMLFGIALTIIEFLAKIHSSYIFIGSVIIAISLLALCINEPETIRLTSLAKLGTSSSLHIMVFHCEIRDTLSHFVPSNTLLFPLVVLSASILLSIVINRISGFFNKVSSI